MGKDDRPSAQGGFTFDHPYPLVQEKQAFHEDFVKDDNGDHGEWRAQIEYDTLRAKLKKNKEEAEKAFKKKKEEMKELEEARDEEQKAEKKAAEAKKKADAARADATEADKKVKELESKAAESDKEAKVKAENKDA